MSAALSWKPIRVGVAYCSPACGGGCTYAEYLAAIKKGDALAAKCGPGYTRRVHENLGWHFCAEFKSIRVYQHTSKNFWASVNGLYSGSASTPKQAIANAIQAARFHRDQITALLRGLEAA